MILGKTDENSLLRRWLAAIGGTLGEWPPGSGGGGPVVDPNILFGYKAGDDWQKSGGTFTRASMATLIDANGMVANAPHNYVKNSEDFSPSTGWAAFGGTITHLGTTTAPDGTNTAAILDFTGTPLDAAWYNAGVVSAINGTVQSVWVKCPSGTTTFTLYSASTVFTATTTWQRFEFYHPVQYSQAEFRSTGATGVLHVWGFQFEHNVKASKYIKTTGAVIITNTLRDNHYVLDPVSATMVRSTLLEGQRTNLLTYSQDFSNIAWAKSGGLVVSGISSPDGGLNAFAYVADATTTAHQINHVGIPGTAPTNNCFSVWLKKGHQRYAIIREFTATGESAIFDLQTGTIASAPAGASKAYMQPFPNGWYRCTLVAATGGTQTGFQITPYDLGSAWSYLGDGVSQEIYVWGAQFEDNVTFSSSYIPTTSAAVTRAADVLGFPVNFPVQEMSAYISLSDVGTMNMNGLRYFEIADSASSAPRLLSLASPPGAVSSYWQTAEGGSAYTGIGGASTIIGSKLELLMNLSANGTNTLHASSNGGTQIDGVPSVPAAPFGAGWKPNTMIWPGNIPSDPRSYQAVLGFSVAKGVRDLAYFRAKLTP